MKKATYPTAWQAQRAPELPAVVGEGFVLNHAELEARVRAAARRLVALGARPQDRVAIGAANSLEWLVLAHAVPRIGGILAPLNTRLAPAESQQWISRLQPKLILADDDYLSSLADVSMNAQVVGMNLDLPDGEQEAADAAIQTEIDPEAIHSIILTSGTSGTPKGVCLTYRNHLSSAVASAVNLGILADDRWLLNLPLFHVGGLAVVLRAALYGTAVVLHQRFEPDHTLRAIHDQHVTQLSLVAATLARLLRAGDHTFPASVRSVLVGGGPIPVGLLEEARARGLPVLPTYGMTETASQVATLSPAAAPSRLRTVGHPLSLCEIDVRDESGQVLDSGQPGVIHIRGPMVATGYWNGEGQIEPLAPDGWLRANDIGSFSADGDLIIHGRADGVIVTGGEKVYPEEVEMALEQLPSIWKAAVCGIEDPEWGEAPVALIETQSDAPVPTSVLREQLAVHLARYKIPRRYIKVDRIPTTPTGKIDRRHLRDLVR